jgi:hypothetical protein
MVSQVCGLRFHLPTIDLDCSHVHLLQEQGSERLDSFVGSNIYPWRKIPKVAMPGVVLGAPKSCLVTLRPITKSQAAKVDSYRER